MTSDTDEECSTLIKFNLQNLTVTVAVTLLREQWSDEKSSSSRGREYQFLPTLWLK